MSNVFFWGYHIAVEEARKANDNIMQSFTQLLMQSLFFSFAIESVFLATGKN